MKREDFREVTAYHVTSVKKIIEQKGSCFGVHCINCPFEENNALDDLCGGGDENFMKRCREFIELSKNEITKERKCYSITDLLRRQVRELQKELKVEIVDSKKLKYLKEDECKEVIKELYRRDFYNADSWLVRLARRIGG